MHVTRNLASNCVRAQVTRQRVTHHEYFGVAQYGSWEKAEAAGRKWVQEQLKVLPERVPLAGQMTKRNSSGVVGVRLADATRRKGGNEYPDWRWLAFWPKCPLAGGTGWSVNKYGDERAFVTAVLARQERIVDRDALDALYLSVRGTKRGRDILKLKQLSPP